MGRLAPVSHAGLARVRRRRKPRFVPALLDGHLGGCLGAREGSRQGNIQRKLGRLVNGLLQVADRRERALPTAQDSAFDDDIGGPADHDEMLDIVAPQQNQLSPLIEIEGVDHSKTGLSAPG
ncbi:hypothetical protein [Chelatococcus sp.]|uniref:hypothetical protein n=1 Tax=Chelatococcus sp. TaxID=1953771 RepID=UPI0025B9209E|nr:hypothetical protein [Chelatococcus sp.]